MALDFPTSPVNGQKYPQPAVAGQPVYTWDGEKWKAAGGGGVLPTILVSDSPPINPPDNALWWESDSGLLYLRYNDGDTSQWVIAAPQPDVSLFAPVASPVFTGDPKAPTPATADNDTSIATTAFVKAQGYAPLADPTLTGNPTAPTPASADNDTSIATTAFVNTAVSATAVRYDAAQSLTAAQQLQARQNVYAAPFDALAYNGMQINGGMDVSQENGTAAVTYAAGSVSKYAIDSFYVRKTGTNAFTVQQVASTIPGYDKSLKLTVTTAQTSIGSDSISIENMIEGYRFARCQWGTANAQSITLGFWVKSSIAGWLTLQAINGAITVSQVVGVNIVAPNVAQWVTITIGGHTSSTWDKTNGTGVRIAIQPAISGGMNIAATVGNTFEITGLVVLPGTQVPSAAQSPFIMRIWSDEVRICQRYYLNETYVAGGLWTWPIDLTSGYRRGFFRFPSVMRIAPAMTITGGTSGAFVASQPKVMSITPYCCELQGDVSGGGYSYITSVIADARL